MEFEIGIVCGRCESYASLGTASCVSCGHALALELAAEAKTKGRRATGAKATTLSQSGEITPSRPEPSPHAPEPAPGSRRITGSIATGPKISDVPQKNSASASGPPRSARVKSTEELMDQAKNFVCRSCSTPVPMGHKFCGRCGAAVPPEIMNARTQFFGQLQAPGKAKLILIRGEGVEGLSYQLNAEQHIVGRVGQLVFDDPFVSPKHANFYYRSNKLVVRDEGSLNGVYLRVRGSVELQPADHFLAGEQVFRFDATPKQTDQAGPEDPLLPPLDVEPPELDDVPLLDGPPAQATRANAKNAGRIRRR